MPPAVPQEEKKSYKELLAEEEEKKTVQERLAKMKEKKLLADLRKENYQKALENYQKALKNYQKNLKERPTFIRPTRLNSVNTDLLAVQWLGICLVTGLLFLALKDQEIID